MSLAPNFITEIIKEDLKNKKYSEIVTRFPPEPSGYAHLGHVFASFLDFQTADEFNGRYHLRMDDSNPELSAQEYVDAIQEDLAWLGWDWGENLFYASDNFDLYLEYAKRLIRQGDAYVDSISAEEMVKLRGEPDRPGQPSPYRDRSVEENLELFEKMILGEFNDGEHILRAKIDLASLNMKLRDPVLYRILKKEHYRAGFRNVYPMYDFQHPLQDALEGITHSMCSLEFIDNRAIYDWLMEKLEFNPRPHQYEFGRRGLEYTVTSKRKLRRLIEMQKVTGWDDPRMPTLRAQRRLGVTPDAMKKFAASIGVNRTNRTVDLSSYENIIRQDLNARSFRVMAVLNPLKVRIENAEAQSFFIPYWPHDVIALSEDGNMSLPNKTKVKAQEAGREVIFKPEIYIEQTDFSLDPPVDYKRFAIGENVRLRGAFVIKAKAVVYENNGMIVLAEIVDEEPRGVIHWVANGIPAEFRLYDRLFNTANPEQGDFMEHLNPNSLIICKGFVERSILNDPVDTRYQFERQGYFWRDPILSKEDNLIFNRIISLKDNWTKKNTDLATDSKNKNKQNKNNRPTQHLEPVFSDQESKIIEEFKKIMGEEESISFAKDQKLRDFFAIINDESLENYKKSHLHQIASWIINDLSSEIRKNKDLDQLKDFAKDLHNLAELFDNNKINNAIAKKAFKLALDNNKNTSDIIKENNLFIINDKDELKLVFESVKNANFEKFNNLKNNPNLKGFFIGQMMRITDNKADINIINQILDEIN